MIRWNIQSFIIPVDELNAWIFHGIDKDRGFGFLYQYELQMLFLFS